MSQHLSFASFQKAFEWLTDCGFDDVASPLNTDLNDWIHTDGRTAQVHRYGDRPEDRCEVFVRGDVDPIEKEDGEDHRHPADY